MFDAILQLLFGHASYGKPGGFYVEGSNLFVATTLLFIATIFVGSLVWLYLDAEKRGKSRIIALLFVVLTGWPASFLWWIWLRPPVKSGR